jgi:hypothetical protein
MGRGTPRLRSAQAGCPAELVARAGGTLLLEGDRLGDEFTRLSDVLDGPILRA